MKIINYLYQKILISFFLCISSCAIIFYIFSLIGNLGEQLTFVSILYLSLLNAFQIFTYIPSVIFLLTLVLFIIILRSKNELLIIREYFSMTKTIMAFFPIAIFFTFVEFNKDLGLKSIEELKISHLSSSNGANMKVIIDNKDNIKTYTILKGLDLLNYEIDEFQKYEIIDDAIEGGEYSNNIKFISNNLITNNYVRFQNNQIINLKKENIVHKVFSELLVANLIIKKNSNKKLIDINFLKINKFIYFIFFYMVIFLVLYNKKLINLKQSLLPSVFLTIFFLLYSLLVTSIELSTYKTEMQFLSLTLVFLVFYRCYRYE